MSDTENPLLCEISDGVALVTFNRPARLNAFSRAMNDQFDELMISLEQSPDVRAVVLTGAGKGFCVGTDMADLSQTQKDGKSESFPHPKHPPALYNAFENASDDLKSRFILPKAMSKPVIAAVNGACSGIGLALACSSDVRFASETTVFTAIFARRGLTAETGLAFMLSALIGMGAASDMLLSGRRIVAAEAEKMGLVSAVLPPDDLLPHALTYARDVAQNVSPRSTAVIKRQIWQAQQGNFLDAAVLAYREAGLSLRSEDFREGVAHFVEKRPPHFTGR